VDIEEVWNPCTVLSRDRNKVKVRYDGWDKSFDEEVPLEESKFSKVGVHTLRRRCWVKATKTQLLPAIAFLRSGATAKGVEYLETEPKLMFRVFDEKKVEYTFLEPKKCVSWSSVSQDKAPKAAVERCLEEAADTAPVIFKTGTLPADESLQLGYDPSRATSEDFIAYAQEEGKKTTSPTEVKSRRTSSDQGLSNSKKRARSLSAASASIETNTPTNGGQDNRPTDPFELTPSERLRVLAASIGTSVAGSHSAGTLRRSIGDKVTSNDSQSKGVPSAPAWGNGSAMSSDEFTIRGHVSSTMSTI